MLMCFYAPAAQASTEITVEEYPKENDYFDGSYVYVDVWFDDIHDFRTYIDDKDTIGNLIEKVKDEEPLLALNGDFWNYQLEQKVIVRNGEVLSDTVSVPVRDYCVIYGGGTMVTYHHDAIKDVSLLTKNAWQIFSFGPQLVHKGEPILDYGDIYDTDLSNHSHPRTAIGYFEPNHYCFLVVAGRNDVDHGCYLEDMARFFSDIGCKEGYNLDGGGSSHIWYKGEELGVPSEDRLIPDIIYIT